MQSFDDNDRDHVLARRILSQALDELRREAVRIGRVELFEQLLPDLLGQLDDDTTAGTPTPDNERRLALTRLRQRLRERVNAQLRLIESDPLKRRALRRRLQVARVTQEDLR